VGALEAWLGIREQKKGPLFVAFSPLIHPSIAGQRQEKNTTMSGQNRDKLKIFC